MVRNFISYTFPYRLNSLKYSDQLHILHDSPSPALALIHLVQEVNLEIKEHTMFNLNKHWEQGDSSADSVWLCMILMQTSGPCSITTLLK